MTGFETIGEVPTHGYTYNKKKQEMTYWMGQRNMGADGRLGDFIRPQFFLLEQFFELL
jgi:hypothetical protein